MARYVVQWDYRAGELTLAEGDVVELDEELAAWLGRDSPGVIVPFVPRRKRMIKRPPRDRMVREGENR